MIKPFYFKPCIVVPAGMGIATVAIVGAGPAGLTLARQLQSADVDVIIIDG